MAAELGVQRLQHGRDRQILGAGDGGGKILPEAAQHRLPVDPAAGDVVELVLQLGGEVVLDVALEEAGQEGGDQPAAILGEETLLLQPVI